MSAPSIHALEVSGIPAHLAEIAVPFTGSLIFGIGLRDETAVTAGTAHLLEHLIMKRVGKVTVAHNASTSDDAVSFFAQGSPGLVLDFLRRVAFAITTLDQTTDADVEEQRKIISAELGENEERVGSGPLLDRFGADSIGLIDLGSPAHRSITREQAIAFAQTWFHAGNAALCFTDAVPDDFELILPPARPLPSREDPSVIRSRQWTANGQAPLCLSIVLDGGSSRSAVTLATALIADAFFAELRTEKHLVYSVEQFVAALTARDRFVAYALDPRPDHVVVAAVAALEVLRRLATEGPTDELLRDGLDQFEQAVADPTIQVEALQQLTTSVLRGRRNPDEVVLPDLTAVTADEVRTVIADSLQSVFVTFGSATLTEDADAVTEAIGLPPAEASASLYSAFTKRELFRRLMTSGVESFAPRMFRGLGGSQFVIDHDRIVCVGPDGAIEIVYEDVVLAAYSEAQRFWGVLASGGDLIFIDRNDWRGDEKIHELLTVRLPADRQVRIDRLP